MKPLLYFTVSKESANRVICCPENPYLIMCPESYQTPMVSCLIEGHAGPDSSYSPAVVSPCTHQGKQGLTTYLGECKGSHYVVAPSSEGRLMLHDGVEDRSRASLHDNL